MRAATLLIPSLFCFSACAEPSSEPAPGKADPAVLDHPPSPGFSGPCPSPAAQGRIDDLAGRPVPVGVGGVTEEEWTVVGFAVVPSQAAPGGKGPIVRFRKGGESRDLHVPDDAAVEALLRGFEGAVSPR